MSIVLFVVFATISNFVAFYSTSQIINIFSGQTLDGVSNLGYEYINKAYPGEWEVKDGNLYKGEVLINNNNKLIDDIAKTTGSVATIFLGDTRIATTITENGERIIGTKANELVSQSVLNGTPVKKTIDIAGKQYFSSYIPIKDKNSNIIGMWFVGLDYSHIANLGTKINLIIMGLFMLSTTIMIVVFNLLLTIIIKTIKKVIKSLQAISAGDLTQKIKPIYSGEELEVLTSQVNSTIDKMSDLLNHIKNSSLTLASTSQQIASSVEYMATTTEQTAKATGEIAAGVVNQTNSIVSGSENLNSIADKIDTITNGIANSTIIVKNTEEDLINTQISIKEQHKKSDERKVATQKALLVMENLNKSAKQIATILGTMETISDKINLLSLNASIEAAHVGAAGAGFVVIAQEVNKLAAESKVASDSINDIISTTLSNITDTAQELKQIETLENVSEVALNDTNNKIQDLTKSVKTILDNFKMFANSMNELNISSDNLKNEISDMAAVSQELSASTEEISATMEEHASTNEQISEGVNQLSKMAVELQSIVAIFKTKQ